MKYAGKGHQQHHCITYSSQSGSSTSCSIVPLHENNWQQPSGPERTITKGNNKTPKQALSSMHQLEPSCEDSTPHLRTPSPHPRRALLENHPPRCPSHSCFITHSTDPDPHLDAISTHHHPHLRHHQGSAPPHHSTACHQQTCYYRGSAPHQQPGLAQLTG